MRRKDKEVTDMEEIEAIIKKAIVCRLGLTDRGEPYIVPVNFGYERNALYFHGAREGRKAELIKRNKDICFEMETDVELVRASESCRWTMRYRSVIGIGKARILEGEEKRHGLKLIMQHYGGCDFDFPDAEVNSALVVRIDIERVTGKKSGY